MLGPYQIDLMGEDQSVFVMECKASLNRGKKTTAFEIVDRAPLPLSQMDFCIISNYSALIYLSICFYVSIFITFLWNLNLFDLFYSSIICHIKTLKNVVNQIIQAFLVDSLFYSNPFGF